MKYFHTVLLLSLALLPSNLVLAQENKTAALFTEIGEALKSGNSQVLSKWFASNLELDILGKPNVCSKNQAEQIMRKFYSSYTPKTFTIIHQSGTPPMRYAVGTLLAGGETFRVTLFVHSERQKNEIQQIRIEKY